MRITVSTAAEFILMSDRAQNKEFHSTGQGIIPTHHAVDLRLPALGQVNDVHSVVVQVLHTTLEVLPQECSRFSRQRNTANTELCETKMIRKRTLLGKFYNKPKCTNVNTRIHLNEVKFYHTHMLTHSFMLTSCTNAHTSM